MLISVIISSIISLIFHLILGSEIISVLITFVTLMAMGVGSTFVVSAIFHLFVKLFGGFNPYYQTFKAFAYVSAFNIVLALIQGIASYITGVASFLNILIFLNIFYGLISLWILVLMSSCLKFYTDLSTKKLVGVWVSSFLLLVLLGVIFSFIRNMLLV